MKCSERLLHVSLLVDDIVQTRSAELTVTVSSHFRVLTMERPDTVSLINRLATYLAFKQRRGNAEEVSVHSCDRLVRVMPQAR